MSKAELLALAEEVSRMSVPSREMDRNIHGILVSPHSDCVRIYTYSVDAVLTVIRVKLPGFMWRVQSCGVSSEAWVAPDLNNPLCPQRFKDDPSRWHDYAERNEVELRPGSDRAAVLALLAATLKAIAETQDQGNPAHD